MENKGYKQIESLRKGMRILYELSKIPRFVPPGELAELTGMPQATVMGYLETFRVDGYVEASPGGNSYSLGCATAMLWSRYKSALEHQRNGLSQKLILIGAEEGMDGSDRNECLRD